jgi:hypothetical protein
MKTLLFALGVLAFANAPISMADQDVPGMHYNAVNGAPCSSAGRFTFGRTPDGKPVACVQFGSGAQWVTSTPLDGEQQIGASCSGDDVAQSPDGRPLLCVVDQGWQLGT